MWFGMLGSRNMLGLLGWDYLVHEHVDVDDAKHLGWEDANGEKAGMRSRARRESRASRGSNWSRPRVSFDRRRRGSDDLERGAAVVENGGTH